MNSPANNEAGRRVSTSGAARWSPQEDLGTRGSVIRLPTEVKSENMTWGATSTLVRCLTAEGCSARCGRIHKMPTGM
jgi:hypothetical protein